MRLDEFDPSANTRDLGSGSGGMGFGGGGGGGAGLFGLLFNFLPLLLGRRLGCGAMLLIGIVGFFLMNSGLFSGGMTSSAPTTQVGGRSGGAVVGDTPEELFGSRVLASTEQVWTQIFQQQGARYQPTTLNFYSRNAQSGCGAAQSAMGPFYCPSDNGVYLDTAFFQELSQRFGAAGDAAQAYVIAHEVGHHIQTITGVSDQVRRAQARASQADGNRVQVMMELQADCYAGVWASRARTPRTNQPVMEMGDLEEAMRAAQAIGDDTLMQQAGRRVSPESFTHGTSAQRMRWLQRGYQTGDPRQCDTFQAASL